MRRPVSRKRILNVASVKKRDAVALAIGIIISGSLVWTRGPSIIVTNMQLIPSIYIWSPTMRLKRSDPASLPSDTSRETDICFPVGVSETIRFATDTSATWLWRRICFSMYGVEAFDAGSSEGGLPNRYLPANDGSTVDGVFRATMQIQSSQIASAEQQLIRDNLTELIFRGRENVDWFNSFTAKVDTNRVKVWYDHTTKLASGNDNTYLRTLKRWHPIRKTLIYDSDEVGKQQLSSYYSANIRRSMGDYYIMDMFMNANANGEDNLSFGVDSVYYWHER